MAADYIPTKDEAAAAWMAHFARVIMDNGSAYGIAPSDAAVVSAAVERFRAALRVSTAPSTRTRGSVCEKDQARNSATRVVRHYSRLIKANLGISDQRKIAIGVRPMNSSRRKIDVPLSSPAISVVAATNGAHVLIYKDSIGPSRRAKPYGATSLQLFVHVGDEIDRDPAQARFVGAYTRTPITVLFTSKDGGKWATYFGRWASRRGEVGTWSSAAAFRVAA